MLGRAAECEFVIDDASVSRRHAEVRLRGSFLEIADLGSRNGTFLAERRIESGPVKTGQLLRFGAIEFTVTLRQSAGDEETVDAVGPTRDRGPGTPEAKKVLSAAQFRVFKLIARGLAEKTIAKMLGLSKHTVHNHTRAIFLAYAVHSRAQLLARVGGGLAAI